MFSTSFTSQFCISRMVHCPLADFRLLEGNGMSVLQQALCRWIFIATPGVRAIHIPVLGKSTRRGGILPRTGAIHIHTHMLTVAIDAVPIIDGCPIQAGPSNVAN